MAHSVPIVSKFIANGIAAALIVSGLGVSLMAVPDRKKADYQPRNLRPPPRITAQRDLAAAAKLPAATLLTATETGED